MLIDFAIRHWPAPPPSHKPPPFSSRPSDTHCNFTGHLISYLVHNKSILISKRGDGGGGGQTRVSKAALQPAPRCLRSAWFPPSSPAALFIFIYRAPAGVEWEDFAFSASHNGVRVCISEPALSTRVRALFWAVFLSLSRVCVVDSHGLRACGCESRDSVWLEVERWSVPCHRRPLCLHVDLLDLQLTNLSAALFSSLGEALNIQRLCLSLAATDSCQLLGRKVCVGLHLPASVSLHLTGVFPPLVLCACVCVCARAPLPSSYLVLGQVHWAMVGRANNCWFGWPVDDTERERWLRAREETHLPSHTHALLRKIYTCTESNAPLPLSWHTCWITHTLSGQCEDLKFLSSSFCVKRC